MGLYLRSGNDILNLSIQTKHRLCVRFYFTANYAFMYPSNMHIWELPGNDRDFIGVMIFYLFCRRTEIILVTAIRGFKIYIHIPSLILFI